jgi:hypothetical protein
MMLATGQAQAETNETKHSSRFTEWLALSAKPFEQSGRLRLIKPPRWIGNMDCLYFGIKNSG